MKVYLDSCCYSRPFDDLGQDRVRVEAEAVLSILAKAERHEIVLVAGDAIDRELSRNPDDLSRRGAVELAALAHQTIGFDEEVMAGGETLERNGLSPDDALHVASALAGEAEYFVTTDIRLARRASRLSECEGIRFLNPVELLFLDEARES